MNYHYFHLKDTAGQELDFHFHDFDKLVILISGRVDYRVESSVYELKPWDVLLVKHISRAQVPFIIGKYKDGRYKELPHLVRHYRTKSVKITCDKPTPINLDGELRTGREAVMEVAVVYSA